MEKVKAVFRKDSRFRLFLASALCMGIAQGIYKAVLDNYLAEIVGINEMERGLTEFFREMPGLILVLVIALFYSYSAERIIKIGAVIMLVGIVMQAVIPPEKLLVIIAIMLFSLGEHILLGLHPSITLQYAEKNYGGEALGYRNSVNEIGKLAGFLVVIFCFSLVGDNPFTVFFWVTAGVIVITGVTTFCLPETSATDRSRSRFYFKKKFKKYYMLEIFYGARKQVFFTFGPYVLILFYGASTVMVSILYAVSSVACFLLSPVVGKIIDRAGYRIVMIMDTLILVIVCFFYGFAHHIFPKDVAFIVCCVNYVLDSIISLASLASNLYVQDISDSPEETRATISTGFSVNHMITIFIALFGGWIWKTLGIEMLFILSAVLGLCNSAYAASIPKKKKEV